MKAEPIPALPTREQELDYLKYLEESISTDPWITLRPKKYMCGPWRLYYKNLYTMKREYYKKFFYNFMISSVGLSGIIIYAASRRMVTSTGVPMTRVMPKDLFTPSNINKLSYDIIRNKYPKRTFRYGIFKYSIIVGLLGGYLFTDKDYLYDDINSRPDLNQFRIMTDNVPDKERKVFNMFGSTYFGKPWKDEPQSWVKKLNKKLFPSVDYNPHSSEYLPFFNYKNKSYYPAEDVSSYYSS